VLVPVNAAAATNNPQNVTVNFTILQPILTLSSSALNLAVNAGQTTAPATVTVTNSGAGTLASLGTIACTPSHPRVTCAVNQNTGVLTITVNSATAPALAAGQHVFSVNVSAPNAGNGSETAVIFLPVN
jgi:hypothetical protein